MNKEKPVYKPSERRLAAIMFTDIVGYTAMMQKDEQAAAAIRQRHREVFQAKHRQCHGEVLQYYGDGTLSIFRSAVEAVECAIAMQEAFQRDTVKVPLRIGLHLGDIVFDENDVYGDGVNLASRIETLGVSGSILLSDKLNFAIKSQSSFSTQSIGYYEFKHIDEPVEVFAISNAGLRVPAREELKGKLKQSKKSIAVLPFVNMSSDPENEYFSDGIAEEILNALVKVEGLQVTARTSSFAFKSKNMDVREIGRQLGVAHILEGSVRKAGNRVRITTQLVSTVDGYHFFSETYDRILDDIFAVQDEIAQKITNRLREHLDEKERSTPLVVAPTENLEAYEQYLKGLFYINQIGDQAAEKAKPYFEKAIALQEDFALPHAYLALCHLFLAFGGQQSWKATYQEGMPHIRRALEIDPDSAIAFTVLASFQTFCEWNWPGLKETCEKLLKIGTGEARIYHSIATYYSLKGDIDTSIKIEQKGLKLNPMSVQLHFYIGLMKLVKGDFKSGRDHLDRVLELVPNHRTALEMKGWGCLMEKNYDHAIAYFNQMSEMGYRFHRSTCLGYAFARKKDRGKALQHLAIVESLNKNDKDFLPYLDLAVLYAGLDQKDQAFSNLKLAIEHKIGDAMMFVMEPTFYPLRSDPRFELLKRKVGLEDLPPLKGFSLSG